jgi:hypothetical protein
MLKQQLAHLFPSSSSTSCESSRTFFCRGGGGGEGSYTQTFPEDVEATFALTQGLQVAEIDKGALLLNDVHLTFGPYISLLTETIVASVSQEASLDLLLLSCWDA